MSLSSALGIKRHDIVCFVGAGGKTSATMLIADELARQGQRVLVTSTTKIIEPLTTPDLGLVLADEPGQAIDSVREQFTLTPAVVLARKRLGAGPVSLGWVEVNYPVALLPHKLEGIPPEWIARLATHSRADVILIEADGANHRLLKAPNGHEPVIPECATLVVPMADTEAIGKPITDEFVHRPVLLADLAGVPVGSPISPEVMAIALAHPNGGIKGAPPRARIRPLLTVHAVHYECINLRKVVRLLQLSPRIDRLAVAYLRAKPPAVEAFSGCSS